MAASMPLTTSEINKFSSPNNLIDMYQMLDIACQSHTMQVLWSENYRLAEKTPDSYTLSASAKHPNPISHC